MVCGLVVAANAQPPRGRGAERPAGARGFGGPGQTRGFGRPEASAETPESKPLADSDEEKRVLEVLNEMDQSQRRGNMNVPLADGRLLRLLAESMGAKKVVEIGTSNGFSGIWFCLRCARPVAN